MKLESMLASFAARRRIRMPDQGPDGILRLLVDGALSVGFSADQPNRFVVFGDVGPVPPDSADGRALLHRLLRLELATLNASDEVLSIDPERNQLVLWAAYADDGLTDEVFDRLLAQFLNALEFWRAQAEEEKPPVSGGAGPVAPMILFP